MNTSQISVDTFDRRAKEYQDKYMDIALYSASFDLFCQQVTRTGAEVLELGCGPGNITRYLLSQRPDLKVLGTDMAPNMIELAKENNPAAEFELMDCRELGKLGQQYDAIMCGFALPYLSRQEVTQLISDAASVLRTGGVLYLSTMEDDDSKSGLQTSATSGDQIYIHYHQGDYLLSALASSGFEIIEVQRQGYPEQPESSTRDLIIIAKYNPG